MGEISQSIGQYIEPWEVSCEGKVVVLGIGNPYMHDDAIGPKVIENLRRRGLSENVVLFDCRSLDLELLSYFKKSSKIVIVDALKSGEAPGRVSKYSISTLKSSISKLPNLHGLELPDLVDVAEQSGMLLCPLTVIGVEPKDCTPGEGLSR